MTISLGIRGGLTAKIASRARRQLRGRKKINGTVGRPRMVVTYFMRHLYVQVVSDTAGRTLVSAPTMETDPRATEGDKFAKVYKVEEIIAQRAKEVGVEDIVFDCAGDKYHGWIVAPADVTREAGLGF